MEVLEPVFDGLEVLDGNGVDVHFLLRPVVEDKDQIEVAQSKLLRYI